MYKNVRFGLAGAIICAALVFAVFGPAHAQEPIVVETVPNTVKLIEAFRTEAVIDAAVINERTVCRPKYPAASIRNDEMGTVKLKLLVNVDGYVVRSRVAQTSGFRELDRAAMIGFMGCKFKPTVKDGVPAETWIDIQYVWKIE